MINIATNAKSKLKAGFEPGGTYSARYYNPAHKPRTAYGYGEQENHPLHKSQGLKEGIDYEVVKPQTSGGKGGTDGHYKTLSEKGQAAFHEGDNHEYAKRLSNAM